MEEIKKMETKTVLNNRGFWEGYVQVSSNTTALAHLCGCSVLELYNEATNGSAKTLFCGNEVLCEDKSGRMWLRAVTGNREGYAPDMTSLKRDGRANNILAKTTSMLYHGRTKILSKDACEKELLTAANAVAMADAAVNSLFITKTATA